MAEVYRYPLKAFTDQTDYLQIDIVEYTPIRKTSGVFIKDPKRTSLAGKPRSRNVNQGKGLLKTILLPMPNQIQDSNSVKYATSELNSIAGAAVGGIIDVMEGGKAFNGGFVSGMQAIGERSKNALDNVSSAVGGLSGAQGFFTRRLASAAVNMLGANISAGQILARSTGEILNPNAEVLFNGVNLRTFKFSFKMIPRSYEEGQQIKEIIKAFKLHSAAKLGSKEQGITNEIGIESFIRTPDIFELRYRKGGGEHPYLHKFKQCFLESVDATYTGESGYATYDDGTPTSLNINLTFREIEPIYDKDQDDAFKSGGVGF